MLQVAAVLSFDLETATHTADTRVALERASTPTGPHGPHDLLTAATARRHQRSLVTPKTREFAWVSGLQLEDWI